jgi:type IV pilus assembly protein PilV
MLILKNPPRDLPQMGFSLIEILITVVILSFGLLGLAALQAKVHGAGLESVQRSQALVILQDMVGRINANRSTAASYVKSPLGQTDAEALDDCPSPVATPADVALCDLSEWSEILKGASVVQNEANKGGLIGAQGCIEEVSAGPPRTLRVTVAWQGLVPTGAPALPCGQGDFGDESLRRVVSTLVTIADLGAL